MLDFASKQNDRVKGLFEYVLEYLEDESGNSRHTARQKRQSLNAWQKEFKLEGLFSVFEITAPTVTEIIERWKREYSINTINVRVTYLKHFCSWLEKKYGITDKVAKVKGIKAAKKAPRKVSSEDMLKLVLAAEEQEHWYKAARDRALVLFLFKTGSRRSETNIRWCDIDFGSPAILRAFGKGNCSRVIHLSPTLTKELKEFKRITEAWLFERFEWQGDVSRYPVFCSVAARSVDYRSLCLSSYQVGAIFQALSAKARVKVTPHQARHTFAYETLERTNKDLLLVSRVLGHSSVSVTERYLERTDEEIYEALNFRDED